MNKEKVSSIILRVSLAFAFIYAAISAQITPDSWIGYFPQFVKGIVPDQILLSGWGVVELVLAIWILSGKKIFIPSVISAISLFGLIVVNLPLMDVIFRDVSILGIAIALAVLNYPKD